MARQAAALAAAAGFAPEGRAQQHLGCLCPSTKASLPHHTEIGAVCLWLVVLQLIVFTPRTIPSWTESGNMLGRNSGADVVEELSELHRKFKVIDEDRKNFSDDSSKLMKKHRGNIEKLKRDNEVLKEELELDAQGPLTQATLAATAHLQKLQEQTESYTRRIDAEKQRIEEVDKKIKSMNAKIMEQRARMGGVHAARENNLKIQKQIKILENRLDKSLVKFNEALAHNKAMRENIDNLRRERVVFDGIYKKLERELEERKREMAKIIEVSNIAFEARDRAQQEMAMLKAQADKEQQNFEKEWRELGNLIEQDKKVKEFMRQREKLHELKGEFKADDEERLRKKIIKGNPEIAKHQKDQKASLERVHSYEEAFAKIQQATGIKDIDELVTTFIEAEDQNFALFNYVNELNAEVEKLEEQINEIKVEIEKYKGAGQSFDNQRKKILKDLEERLEKTEARAALHEQKADAAARTIAALKSGIQSVFEKIGCSATALSDMLGNGGVTEGNMMQYLGIIEQRTNEILQMYAAVQMQQQGSTGEQAAQQSLANILGQGPQVATGVTSISINPPNAGALAVLCLCIAFCL
jgi:coiled-coil domain-containing protein 63/114